MLMPQTGSGHPYSGSESHRGSERRFEEQAPLARSEDIARRRRRYIIQMGIRVACVLLLPVLPGWWKLLALAGAVVLPYVAVLMANDHNQNAPDQETYRGGDQPPALPAESGDAHHHRTMSVDDDGTVHVEDEDGTEDPDQEAP